MEDTTLRIDIESHADITVLTPYGDVDMNRTPALREKLSQAQRAKPSKVVVDLAHVEYMDSSGLATLVEAMRNAKRFQVELVLCSLNPRVLAIFEIARLQEFFTIRPTLDEACQSPA